MMRLIVMGNEKGGSGKSTTAMHLITALVRAGHSVGALDLDLRQKSLFRYLDNRQDYMRRHGIQLPMPRRLLLEASTLDSRAEAEAEEESRFAAALVELAGADYVVVDCPGSYSTYSRLAHARADTLITPMNDSLVDFDMLARLDPASGAIRGPSVYSEMVWKARQARAASGRRPMDWVVLRNRMTMLDARNKRRVASALDELARRIGFRLIPGFSERVVFRELFLSGLTLLDLREADPQAMSMSNIAARQEVRDLVRALELPAVSVAA
ncbi:division plane positioning ATPase MipZ [Amaricoccus sp.]|uniref:division plane positioning ATPase MipZ n=1 Tax=Amaricoccus sp. TaxID=1872485 RepID=UPI002636CC64|nr:division plane positioning ATPase MipZ [Amaricoccus sp.]HRO10662.1 division plane positioning ATPase MipZ [Amaricoccus sp.]